jgi:hypothetical protein
MAAQKLIVPQLHFGRICRGVAEPQRIHTIQATPASSNPTDQVARAPIFSVHFPTFSPIRFEPNAIQITATYKQNRCQEPERDGTWSGMRADRNPSCGNDAGDGKQREVPQSELAFERRFRSHARAEYLSEPRARS